MSFFSQTVSVPHGVATLLVSAQTTNTAVWVQTTSTNVLIGDSGVDATGWPLPSYTISYSLEAGDEIYAFYNSASGSASVQVLVTTVAP